MTTNIFSLEKFDDFSEKINIDELYDKKKQQDLDQLTLYNKILNRIHVKIKTTSRHQPNEQMCWFVVPEIIMGVPRYDQAACIAYVLDKLQTNGFSVRYIHPNVIFICWKFWVPSYVRDQLKKKTGMVVDEFGKKVEENDDKNEEHPLAILANQSVAESAKTRGVAPKKEYASTKTYRPQGNLVYNDELVNMMDLKLN